MRLAIAIAASFFAASAFADATAELEARGEALAKEGRFSEAIEAFKAADRAWPTAGHKCLIALAYARREAWPQAEIFMAKCHIAPGDEQVPEWVAEADALIKQRLQTASVAPVQIVAEPATANIQIAISSFAPDETFTSGTRIHLPVGRHVIFATASGYEPVRHPVDISDKAPRTITITLHRPAPPTQPLKSRLPRYLMITGVATVGAGVVAYGAMAVAWSKLREDGGTNFHTSYETTYLAGRAASIALWAVGTGLAVTGLVLHARHREVPAAGLVPLRGGAAVTLEWRR